jgi:Na+-driven multidrug efflux pump
MNPIIAVSVAMLPFAGRLVGKRDWLGVRKGISQAVWAAVTYSFLLVAPLLWIAGPWLASALSESPLTARYTTFALYLAPLACALTTPFFLARPVFEAMGQGKPGLIMAAVRTLMTVPFAWGGMLVAQRLGYPDVYGLMVGLLLVGTLSGGVFIGWLRAALPTGSAPPTAFVASDGSGSASSGAGA